MKISLPEGKGLIALSGGADSVALLRLALDHGAQMEALHCNFHLRGPESDRDERFVRQLCHELGVTLHIEHFATKEHAKARSVSLEMAAREQRYAWFEEMRQRLGATWIAVAHHQEDQAETILLNLVRGTGPKGLCGMRPRNGYIVRPLLDFSKEQLLSYLEQKGQPYVTDSTNLERDALRNRIRLDVMPLLSAINPQAVAHICQTAALLQSQDKAPTAAGHTLHSLYEWLNPYGFSLAQQRDILRDIEGPSGAIYESATHRLLRSRGQLILEEKAATQLPQLVQRIEETTDAFAFLATQPKDARYAYLDADLLTLPLKQRFVQLGDSFQPFGMGGRRKLVSDLLTDLKLSRFEKERQTVALSGDVIAWVVGRRSDHRFRVTRHTRRILCLRVGETT